MIDRVTPVDLKIWNKGSVSAELIVCAAVGDHAWGIGAHLSLFVSPADYYIAGPWASQQELYPAGFTNQASKWQSARYSAPRLVPKNTDATVTNYSIWSLTSREASREEPHSRQSIDRHTWAVCIPSWVDYGVMSRLSWLLTSTLPQHMRLLLAMAQLGDPCRLLAAMPRPRGSAKPCWPAAHGVDLGARMCTRIPYDGGLQCCWSGIACAIAFTAPHCA